MGYEAKGGRVKNKKYYQGLAGYRDCRRNHWTKGYNVLYDANQQYLDDAGGRWITVCEEHGELMNHETLATARRFLPHSLNWCQSCRDLIPVTEVKTP
jgi:hypothetical protein